MTTGKSAKPAGFVQAMYPSGGPGRHLKARLKAGDVLVGGIAAEYLRPSLMKMYAHAGFDFVYIEYEHAFFDPAALSDATLAARSFGLPPIAKTPDLERAEVAKLLECGVVGVQLPRTESREQVETLRNYLKFPPNGTRAVAPGYGNSDYVQPADLKAWMAEQDAETTVVVHIETELAYRNAEEIVSTPGVDMVYLGAGDFSIEMGHPGEYEHPGVVGPMEEVLELCKKHGVPWGTTASSAEAAGRWVSKGARFFETADELDLIREAAAGLVGEYRGLGASSPSEDYLTVLAGQRQWIATTNFAGCPGRPPDSFANSAVLTTSAKVPDALGWPIDPCFPVQIDPKAEQFEQVVACADQRPFAVHLLQSPQQELPESPALLDLAEYRLHSLHPQSVALPTPPGL